MQPTTGHERSSGLSTKYTNTRKYANGLWKNHSERQNGQRHKALSKQYVQMRHNTSQRVCNDESYKHCSVHSFNMSPYFIVINVDWHHYTSLPWYWYLIAYQSRDNTNVRGTRHWHCRLKHAGRPASPHLIFYDNPFTPQFHSCILASQFLSATNNTYE